MRRRRLSDAVKRAMDVAVAGAGLVATAPLMGAVAVGVAATMGRPVLFRQQRPGRDGRPFELIKFRTMKRARDERAARISNDAARVTKTGEFLRSTSLDELPTLWNVVRGDMSLVGPRPLLMRYLDRYTQEQARRHEVRPGITGWAQVHGRNAQSWDERLRLDVWYVDHRSLALDLKILWRTAATVVHRDGISHEGAATMPEFMGSAANAGEAT